MNRKLKVGIIGCGRISVMHLLPAVNLKQSELVCVCDVKKDRADAVAEKYAVKAYYDYKEMFEKEKLDAVHVCLPHHIHVEVSVYAMEHGVNVLSEKPMSINYQSAVQAVETAKRCGVNYGVILQCRYNDSAKLVKKAVQSGKLGKVLGARSTLTWWRPEDVYYLTSDWKGTWEKAGGGVVLDQAIHSIDLVNWIVNSKVEEVSCHLSSRAHKSIDVEDTGEGCITYKNGVKYVFYCTNNYTCNEPIEIRFHCQKGSVVMDYDNAVIKYEDGTIEEVHATNHEEIEGAKDYWGFQHDKQIENFYNACLGLDELDISGEEALKTHKLIFDIYSIGKQTENCF